MKFLETSFKKFLNRVWGKAPTISEVFLKLSNKDIETIKQNRIFARVSPEELPEGEIKSYKSGDAVCSPENTERIIGIVLGGKVSVYSADENKSVLLRSLSASDAFGVSNLFSTDRFVSRVVAKTASRVLFYRADDIRKLMDENRDFVEDYVAFLSERIRFLNRKILFYTSGSAERRLALYLSSFEGEKGLSMSGLAELLDVGRASLYRALRRLEKDGFITKNGNEITVKNREKMLEKYKK